MIFLLPSEFQSREKSNKQRGKELRTQVDVNDNLDYCDLNDPRAEVLRMFQSVMPSLSSLIRVGNLIWRTSKVVERTDLLEEQAELVCPSGKENSSFVPRRGASYFRPILE